MKYQKEYQWKLKQETINFFGGRCICCDENKLEFLTLSHPNNDGSKHRRLLSKGWNAGGWIFYSKLKKTKFKTDFTIEVLCQNCNTSLEHYGYCPHKSGQGSRGRIGSITSQVPSLTPMTAPKHNEKTRN